MKFTFPLLIIVALICGCTIDSKPTCNRPYILVGNDCCLDENDDRICDRDKPVTTLFQGVKTTSTTSTTMAIATTSTTMAIPTTSTTMAIATTSTTTTSTSSTTSTTTADSQDADLIYVLVNNTVGEEIVSLGDDTVEYKNLILERDRDDVLIAGRAECVNWIPSIDILGKGRILDYFGYEEIVEKHKDWGIKVSLNDAMYLKGKIAADPSILCKFEKMENTTVGAQEYWHGYMISLSASNKLNESTGMKCSHESSCRQHAGSWKYACVDNNLAVKKPVSKCIGGVCQIDYTFYPSKVCDDDEICVDTINECIPKKCLIDLEDCPKKMYMCKDDTYVEDDLRDCISEATENSLNEQICSLLKEKNWRIQCINRINSET